MVHVGSELCTFTKRLNSEVSSPHDYVSSASSTVKDAMKSDRTGLCNQDVILCQSVK